VSWIRRLFARGEKKETPLEQLELWCSFCGKHRREVKKLIAGPSVYICDECLLLCDQILDDEQHQQDQRSYFGEVILAQVRHLGPKAPHARVQPMLRAVIELERHRAPGLRAVIAVAVTLDDFETAVQAARAIPVSERTATDVLNLAAFLTELGSYGEALTLLGTLERSKLDGVDALLHALHEALATIERGGLAARDVATLRGRVTELGAACEALPAGGFEDQVRAERLAVMTIAALAAGSIDGAENAARARVALHPQSWSAHEFLARVLAARGDDAGAAKARATARELAHPDGLVAQRLAEAPTNGPFR
jgi:hypothetical protein